MPTRLILHVIYAADVPFPPPLNALGDKVLPDWFAGASQGELQLEILEHRSTTTSVDVDGALLQAMFREFVSSPPPGTLCSEIALLFCRSWRYHDLAGLMFDYDGSDLPPGAHVAFDGVPRQACAVFLDALDGSPADHLYVAVHELGHVFNLHHDSTGDSFMGMDVSGRRAFLDTDRARLTAAGAGQWPERVVYLPGGAPFKPESSGATFRIPRRRRPGSDGRRGGLALRLDARSFLIAEPVVLDVDLRLPPGTILAGGGLEPGFDGMRVWYRTPVGEVRLFAPVRHYCAFSRAAGPGRTATRITNNARIHLGRQGLSFRDPGSYSVWAEVDVRSRRGAPWTLTSPPLEFRIRGPRNDEERDLSSALGDPQIANFVANKAGALDPARAQRVERVLADVSPSHPAVRHLRYASATASLRAGQFEAAADLLEGVSFSQRSLRAGLGRLHEELAKRGSAHARTVQRVGRRGRAAS